MKKFRGYFQIYFLLLIVVFLVAGCGKKAADQWEPQEFDRSEPAAGQGVQVLPADDSAIE